MKLIMDIVCSLVVHVVIIITALTVIGRDWKYFVPADHLTVKLESRLSEIHSLHAIDHKKQAFHKPVLTTPDKAASGPYEYGAPAMDKATPATGRADSRIISSPVTGNNTEEKNTKDPVGAAVGSPGPARGGPSSSPSVGYQSLQSGDFAQGQAKTQHRDKNSEDVMAIRKAVERALVYPLFAKKRGLEGTALTEFTVNAKGHPEDIRIIGSSGYNILDIAAKESLIKAAPFNAGKGRYEIPITFRLKSK